MDVDSDDSVATAIAAIYAAAGNHRRAGQQRRHRAQRLHRRDYPSAAFREVMETNYFGAIRCIKAVLPHMRERRSGCIVNITSVAGRVSTSPLGPYAASKLALEALSEALAQEMKTFNVRVAIVEPGIIDTPMAQEIESPRQHSPLPAAAPPGRNTSPLCSRDPTPPSIVAEKIQSIIESGTWQLRHPVGGGAEAFLASRLATRDEDYIALQGADDETWYTVMEQRTGLSLRPRD